MRAVILSVALILALAGAALAQELPAGLLRVQGSVYLLPTPAGNVVLQVGDEGVLIVDTSVPASTPDIVAAVRRLSDKPIRWIINTHAHPDHTGGNAALSTAGEGTPQNQFGSGRNFPGSLLSGAVIVAHETVLHRMSGLLGDATPTPQASWPVAAYIGSGRDMFFNGESIQIFHAPNAHTDGDSIVYFRYSDVLVTGDVFNMTSYPRIDLKSGGSIDGLIGGLNLVLDVAIPKEKQEGGTFVVPGHGRIGDEADVVQYRNMVTIVRDRIRDMLTRGMTLEQIKAAKPTSGYDRRWSTPSWTADMFVEAAYQTLRRSTTSARR